jgi:hypothetical protein
LENESNFEDGGNSMLTDVPGKQGRNHLVSAERYVAKFGKTDPFYRKPLQSRYHLRPVPAARLPPSLRKSKKPPLATWIYLVDGARLRVDEVREVSDGAWYNRGNVAIFLDKERISRIERETPETAGWRFEKPRLVIR